MVNLSQYQRIPGSARRYIDKKTGKELSRWAYQKIQGGGDPKKLAAERAADKDKRGSKSRAYAGYVKAYKAKTAAKLGVKEKDIKVRGNSKEAKDFRKNLAELRALNSRQAEIQRKLKGAMEPTTRNELEHEFSRNARKQHNRLVKINFRSKEFDAKSYESKVTA